MAETEFKNESEKTKKAVRAMLDLSSEEKIGVVIRVLSDQEFEDLIDNLAADRAEKSPTRPFEEYLAEWEARHKKKAQR